jgi:hypothetical protein
MATYSPTILAYPVGTTTGGGISMPGEVTPSNGEGVKSSPIGGLGIIECRGYEELYLSPLAEASGAQTPTFYIFGFYGNKQSGGEDTQYVVKLLGSMTTADAGFNITFDNKSYKTKNPTFTAAFTGTLDGVIGCTTTTQAGTTTVIGTVGIAHLGGADLIGIAVSSGTTDANMLVRFG